MPGLLDLPPELLEQIHFAHERLVEAEHENSIGIAEKLGHSRLTCRYFEHATRRGFVVKNFAVWIVRFPEDASIQKLCAMAVTPDLAAAIRKLVLFVDDDYTMEVQNADDPNGLDTLDAAKSPQDPRIRLDNKESSQVQRAALFDSFRKRVTQTFDNITGSLVPIACLRHRAALIEAFRACMNVNEILIGNRSLEPELMHRYKRSSRVHGIRPPPEDDGDEQDEDGSDVEDESENANDDRSGDGEEPANDGFSGSSDYGKVNTKITMKSMTMPKIKEVLVMGNNTTTIQAKAATFATNMCPTTGLFCSTSPYHTATHCTSQQKPECVRSGSYLSNNHQEPYLVWYVSD